MRDEVRWEHMFPDELERAFGECPVVYFPYGLCEPHGPQNALGCDSLRAHRVCVEAARRHGGIAAPVNYWHVHGSGDYASWAHAVVGQVQRPWLSSLPPWMFFKNLCYHVRAAEVLGFGAALFFSGHGGPHTRDWERVFELIQPHVGTRLAAVGNDDDQVEIDEDIKGWADHAGRGETSVLWAAEPSCVDLSRLPDKDAPGPHFAMHDNAYETDRRKGERLLLNKAEYLGRRGRQLLTNYEKLRPPHTLRTYEDVEKLWEQHVAPHLKDFASMQDLSRGQEPVPEDSVWYANWRVPKRRT